MLATDDSIRDRQHLEEIKRAIVGTDTELVVTFVEHAKRDHRAEAEQRDRIKNGSDEVERPFWRRAVYIHKWHKGQKDHISKPATDQHKREHAAEWALFEQASKRPPKHSIELLPGNDVCTQAAFDELNIQYIEDFLDFAEAKPEILDIFSELVPLLEAAKRWRTFMKPRLKMINGKIANGDD